jgi:vacuolar-type H+-ATPase subunit I/STV1
MTDKQIIIEDCPYFIGGNCQEYLDGVCENHKCDLKIIRELEQKLKAKEQECEELKKIINEAKNSKLDLNSFFAIEATVGEYQLELDQLKSENKHLNDLLNNALKELEKARETLTEIKEIASINAINTCWTVLNLCDKCEEKQNCDIQCPLFKFKLILQKISEVIYE